MSITVSWRKARLTLWSSNCQKGRKKKHSSKREIFFFSFFQCVEKLIGKHKVFGWSTFCVHPILSSQSLLPTCSNRERRHKAVPQPRQQQYTKIGAAQGVPASVLLLVIFIQYNCMKLCAWCEVWGVSCLLVNLDRGMGRSVCCLFCVSGNSPHVFGASRGQKAEMLNKNNV